MKTWIELGRTCLVGACAIALVTAVGGCPGGGADGGGGDDEVGTTDTGTDTTGTEPEPDPPFNYIPLNDEACDLSSASVGVQQAVDMTILDLLSVGTTLADDGFEVCTAAPLGGCIGCTETDNNFLQLINDIDAAGFTEMVLGEGVLTEEFNDGKPENLLDYIQRALHYPYRNLVSTVSACSELEPGSCPELCWNGADDDNDGLTDCEDDNCAGTTACITGELCDDDIDNDGDGAIDCGDDECARTDLACVAELCDNGVDDDNDGFADCADHKCEHAPACGAEPARLTLTQGARQPCEDGTYCGHFSIEPESLDQSCTQFSLRFYGLIGDVVDEGNGAPVTGARRFRGGLFREAVEDVTFGFVIPLVSAAELPPLDPPLTGNELEAWLETLAAEDNSLEARLRDPIVDLRINADGTLGCGKLEGRIEANFIGQFLEGEDPIITETILNTLVPMYEDPDHPGDIPAILSFTANEGTFTSGAVCQPNPCAEESGECTGEVLDYTLMDGICQLQRPQGFETGQSIDPSCGPGPIYMSSVDCGALGANCDAGGATCDPAWKTPESGDLAITEIYSHESGNNRGLEWVELRSLASVPLALNDCRFHGRDTLYGERESVQGFSPVLIAPGDTFVMGYSYGEPTNPHGVAMDLEWVAEDGVALIHGEPDAFRVECRVGGEYVEVDRVGWNAMTDHAALSLDPSATSPEANDDLANWCDAVDVFHSEDPLEFLGTPGAANPACP